MKNSAILGAFVGLIIPVLAYVIMKFTDVQITFFSDKPIAIYVIAGVINLGIFRFTYRAGKDSFAKGVLFITFVAMMFLIFATKLTV